MDLTVDWMATSPSVSSSGEAYVYYYNYTGTTPYDTILVTYDSTTLQPISVLGYKSSVSTEFPDLTGMLITSIYTLSNGYTVVKLGLFTPDVLTQADVKKWVELYYDALGHFQSAFITTIDDLPISSVNIPPLVI